MALATHPANGHPITSNADRRAAERCADDADMTVLDLCGCGTPEAHRLRALLIATFERGARHGRDAA